MGGRLLLCLLIIHIFGLLHPSSAAAVGEGTMEQAEYTMEQDGDADDMNFSDSEYTRAEIIYLFKQLGLNQVLSSQFSDMLLVDGDVNGDGVINASEMREQV